MATVVGVGVDILEVRRLARAYERFGDRLVERVFTPEEAAYCLGRADWASALAGRFAAKEAVLKAISPEPPHGLMFREINIRADGGRPAVALTGAAAAAAAARGVTRVFVSISHEKEYAVATATAVGDGI